MGKPFGKIKKGAFTKQVGKPTVGKANKILGAKDGTKLSFGKKKVDVTPKLKKRASFDKSAQEHKFGIKEREPVARHSDSVVKE